MISNSWKDDLASVGMNVKTLSDHIKLPKASVLVLLVQDNLEQEQKQKQKEQQEEQQEKQKKQLQLHLHESDTKTTTGNRRSHPQPQVQLNSRLYMLMTQRPLHLKSHPGEVCFPGGHQDPHDDNDDVRTALREAYEEVGIDPNQLHVLCRLDTVQSAGGLCVTPIVATVRTTTRLHVLQKHNDSENDIYDVRNALTLNKSEVDAAFWIPVDYIADLDNCSNIEQIMWKGTRFNMYTYMYFDHESQRTFKIWGLTAHVAYVVAKLCCTIQQPMTQLIMTSTRYQQTNIRNTRSVSRKSSISTKTTRTRVENSTNTRASDQKKKATQRKSSS